MTLDIDSGSDSATQARDARREVARQPIAGRSAGAPREGRGVSRRSLRGLAATYQFRHTVTVVNVSGEGMGVESYQPVPFVGRGRMRMEIGGQTLEWEVSLKWCRLARTRQVEGDFLPVFAAGFRLLEEALSLPDDLCALAASEVTSAVALDG